jgi:two-component system response regulator (stage 0 sporulation protein F)
MRQDTVKRKLLLAEDDEPCRILVSEILRGANVQIFKAWDGMSAKQIYSRHANEIELVIIDICLPGLDGFELLKQIKIINPHVITLALSALAPALLIEKCELAGFNSLISKPFDSKQFYQTVISFLKKPQQRHLVKC